MPRASALRKAFTPAEKPFTKQLNAKPQKLKTKRDAGQVRVCLRARMPARLVHARERVRARPCMAYRDRERTKCQAAGVRMVWARWGKPSKPSNSFWPAVELNEWMVPS